MRVPDDGSTTLHCRLVSGIVSSIRKSGATAHLEHWHIWWEKNGTPKQDDGTIALCRAGSESARVTGTGVLFDDVVEQRETMGSGLSRSGNLAS